MTIIVTGAKGDVKVFSWVDGIREGKKGGYEVFRNFEGEKETVYHLRMDIAEVRVGLQ